MQIPLGSLSLVAEYRTMKNMYDVVKSLGSEKVKERQEGLAAIREVFSQDGAVESFATENGKVLHENFLLVFQAIFRVVGKEKDAATRVSKTVSTAAALRRLSDAASALRWLIERTVHLMNSTVATTCIKHVTKVLYESQGIFEAVALDYSKALRCILGYTPHLDHLKEGPWLSIVGLAFNVVLGDPLKRELIDEDELEVVDEVDSDMYVDDTEDTEGPSTFAKGKKRSRRDATPLPILSPRKAKKLARWKKNVVVSVTLEQVEFISVLRLLLSAPNAPLLPVDRNASDEGEDPDVASTILLRLQRFLETYPADSSLLRDYIAILSAVLDNLSFNKVSAVQNFARSTWDGLIGLWGTKDKTMKEGLLVVLRQLFPFITSSPISEQKLSNFDCAEGIGRLWHLLDGEAENRWGVDGLSLDALRLEIVRSNNDTSGPGGMFVAKTFQAGWNFDAGQALSWAMLELQADCAAKLFIFSESMQSTRSETKRIKIENPILTLLRAIQTKNVNEVRSYHLQVLLFFLDRHWAVVHDVLKQDIMNVLLQFAASDDVFVQSWVFLNFAAIAYAEGLENSKDHPLILNSDKWDTIWTHTVRRVNVPGVCRAACHAGYTLLLSSQRHSKSAQGLISNHRVLLEIEALLKDMDVQGPSYPFDSVCNFLVQCLIIAGQDVRLYRMHLEDKVLSWFIDNWKIVGNRMKMAAHAVIDILSLLETLCGLSKRSTLSFHVLLPETYVVGRILEENKVRIIRDFVLFATMPPFSPRSPKLSFGGKLPTSESKDKFQSVAPRSKERKISTFFLRSLESLTAEWEVLRDQNPTAEMARRSLDFALTAILFESLLAFNGTSVNRQVMQNAGTVISIITPLLLKQTWILPEKVLIAQAFEQLLFDVRRSQDDGFREALACPGEYSGIKERLLHGLSHDRSAEELVHDVQLPFLRQIWQNQDFQEAIGPVVATFRTLLKQLLVASSDVQEHVMDVDEKDGFGPIRTSTRQNATQETANATGAQHTERLLETCISFLACGPYLQSSSEEATRDPELTQLIVKSADDPNKFIFACPILFRFVRQKIYHSSLRTLQRCILCFGDILKQYPFSKRQPVIISFLDFLRCSLGIWKADDELAKDVHSDLRSFYQWLSGLLKKRTYRSWALRDAIARFLGQYLAEDPTQESWIIPEDIEQPDTLQNYLPTYLLPRLHSDQDIRVRFRAAVLNADLFSISHHFRQLPLDVYEYTKSYFPLNLESYEHMLTRLLALGNVLVVSAAVRRGAYWHLLETCIPNCSYSYSSHIETILIDVSRRLGMPSLSTLFEAYASQLTFSLLQRNTDFLCFPPHLLGYQDRKQCVEATFRSFSPLNILTSGGNSFEQHCKLLQKNVTNGLLDCFGDVVGLKLLNHIYQYSEFADDMEQLLRETFSFVQGFRPCFEDSLDVVVTTVLKSLGDQDFSGGGSESIVAALQKFDTKMISAFQSLTRYRSFDSLRTHPPNRPAFSTSIVLQNVQWLSTHWGGFSSNTTYHVLHQLINDINRTPLVNEQMRLINALSLWISYRPEDIMEPTIADTLIHGATFLLSQSDLARAAQSILEWAFARYPPAPNWKESRLPNMLVRIRCIIQDFCSETNNPRISALGEDLVKWMDVQMMNFTRKSAYRKLVLRVLPTWPQQPSSALAKLYDEISLLDLSSILEDHRITSNKFRLVRRLRERALLQDHDKEQFSKVHFWRLKECIPSLDQLQEGDVDAFASLLSFYHGQVGSLNVEQPNMLSPRNRHRRNVKKRTAEDTVAARDAITLGLLVMLDDDNPSRVFSAYDTLRLAMSVSTSGDPLLVIPAEYRKDLECLTFYKRPPVHRIVPDIQGTLKSDQYLQYSRRFNEWVSQVSILLSDALAGVDSVFSQLSSALVSDFDFAEQVLPILVHTVLQVERQNKQRARPVRDSLSEYFTAVLSSSTTDIRCTRSIVEIVLHLRNFTPRKSDALAYNKWLEVDFSLLARSAILCGAYTTALLFVELSAETLPLTAGDDTTEKVLYEIYAHIDEPDGFYGIRTQDLQQFLLKRFHHEKQWDKAFRFHAAALEADGSQSSEQLGLLHSFHSFGFNHLAIDTLRCFRESASSLSTFSMNYKLGWRTETWDLPEHSNDTTGAALYRSLRAIYRERDMQILDNTIRNALYEEMERLQSLGSENLAEIRMVSQDLMCLSEILHWRRHCAEKLSRSENLTMEEWGPFIDIGANFDFGDLEAIMATRIALVRSVRQREERQQLGDFVPTLLQGLLDIEKSCLLRLSQAARSSGQGQIALNSVVRAKKLDKHQTSMVDEEFANVLWLQKEETPAVQFLQNILKQLDPIDNGNEASRHALLLSRLGSWTSEACLEKPADIWGHYFSRSISLLGKLPQNDTKLELTRATVYRECAMFAERQYHAVLKSPDALRWKLYVDRKKNEIEHRSMEITRTQSDVMKKRLNDEQKKAQRLLETDSELFKKHNDLRESLLTQAIEMHSRCLETSSDFDDDSAIRLCSLWFANFDDASILHAVGDALDRIPSRKLIFLAHQITARVSISVTGDMPTNQEVLQRLVIRMCQEHPFHTLYQMYCISDRQLSENRRHSGRLSQSTQTERGIAATNILDRLRNSKEIGTKVSDIERVCDACLEWAKFPICHNPYYKKKPKGSLGFSVPGAMKILQIKGSNAKVPVPTARIPLDPTLKYENCVWINHYEKIFETAGGINLPKVSFCIGSDGQKYKQLFKGEGNDDLRQDAVMEQVFDLVNNLLRRDRETKRRDLRVRDYKVVPLSNQAGLLEFVGNTSALRDWLSRSHPLYHPDDMKSDEIQGKIKEVQEEYKHQPEKQLELFLGVRKKFRPVLRHYFTEKHKVPIPWFTMRLNYIRSVATTSIVGHVLGLGDRHVSNILLDNVTGEVVHIDLGIAFDQGKLLPVPERVPFRMTADIVDGMGISGTAGVFQRCAEETLRVLRDESGVIMTVLEVFKHDPLHSWTASEIKVKQAQSDVPTTPSVVSVNDTGRFNIGIGIDMSSGSADEAADRALSSVARKLDKSLSVQSTVNELIAEATDPMNLATIFYGWSAHM